MSKTEPKQETANEPIGVPESHEAFLAMIESACECERNIQAIELELDKKVASLRRPAVIKAAALYPRLAEMLAAIETYAEENWHKLAKGKAKTVKLPAAVISTRKGTAKTDVFCEAGAIAALRVMLEAGQIEEAVFRAIVETKESLRIDVLKAKPELLAKVPGVKVVTGEDTISVTLKHEKAVEEAGNAGT